MNIRTRQQMKALEQQKKPPIMAVIRSDDGSAFNQLIFIHPDDWAAAKEEYGDRIQDFFGEEETQDEAK